MSLRFCLWSWVGRPSSSSTPLPLPPQASLSPSPRSWSQPSTCLSSGLAGLTFTVCSIPSTSQSLMSWWLQTLTGSASTLKGSSRVFSTILSLMQQLMQVLFPWCYDGCKFCFHDATNVAGPVFTLAWSASALTGSCRVFRTVSIWVLNAKILNTLHHRFIKSSFCSSNFKLTTHSSQGDWWGNLSRELAWYICFQLSSFNSVHVTVSSSFLSISCPLVVAFYGHSWGHYLLFFYLGKISFIW